MKNPMPHVTHINDDHSFKNPGVTWVVNQLSQYLIGQEWPTTILTTGQTDRPVVPGLEVKEFPISPGGQVWHYPQGMKAYLDSLGEKPDQIFHLHGVWMAPQWLAAQSAARYAVPSILTTMGQLNPFHWHDGNLRRVKKLIYWHTLAYPAFRNLTVIHAKTSLEYSHLAQLFPGQRIEVVPSAINLENVDQLLADLPMETNLIPGEPYILFLGRLHPQKGIDILIQAFARSNEGRRFQLVIVGPEGKPHYKAELKALAALQGTNHQILFRGSAFGSEKWQLFKNAWAVCLPSRNEGLSAVALEVAATGTPIITTHASGLSNWDKNGGIVVDCQIEDLVKALRQVLSWSESERQARGQELRQLVERRYSWEIVGPQYLNLYRDILK